MKASYICPNCKCEKKWGYSKLCWKCYKKTIDKDMSKRFGKYAEKGNIPWNIKEKPSYRSIHLWAQLHLGKPENCSMCGIKANGHSIHWANKSHEYKREVNDWIRLCAKCHWDYDKKSRLQKQKLLKDNIKC